VTTTDQIPDDYTHDDSCWAEANLAAITGVRMVERNSGHHRVRVDAELDTVRCDTDTFDDPLRTQSYTDLTLDAAERLAWDILTAVDHLRTGEA
jgi:hypothetical protein